MDEDLTLCTLIKLVAPALEASGTSAGAPSQAQGSVAPQLEVSRPQGSGEAGSGGKDPSVCKQEPTTQQRSTLGLETQRQRTLQKQMNRGYPSGHSRTVSCFFLEHGCKQSFVFKITFPLEV